MAVTTASGTQTATVATEHSLATTATAGIFVFSVNLTNMALIDVLELRMKTKVLTGDTAEQIYIAHFTNIPESVIVQSPPVVSMFSLEITLKQTAGTGRAFPWSLVQIDG